MIFLWRSVTYTTAEMFLWRIIKCHDDTLSYKSKARQGNPRISSIRRSPHKPKRTGSILHSVLANHVTRVCEHQVVDGTQFQSVTAKLDCSTTKNVNIFWTAWCCLIRASSQVFTNEIYGNACKTRTKTPFFHKFHLCSQRSIVVGRK